MVIHDSLKYAEQVLQKAGNDNPSFEARLILCHVLGLDMTGLTFQAKQQISEEQIRQLHGLLQERLKHKPLQYLLGTQEFMSLTFNVGQGVLIPRSDTETLVETVLEQVKGEDGLKILDIGTGSGCIGISLAYYHKGCTVECLDVNPVSLETARRNAQMNHVEKRTVFNLCDILSEEPAGLYDVIVSNPPYIERQEISKLMPEVQEYEPHIALDGGADGLDFYRRITEIAPKHLISGGLLAYEIGYEQGHAVAALMKEDFSEIEIIKDLCKNDRVVTGRKK